MKTRKTFWETSTVPHMPTKGSGYETQPHREKDLGIIPSEGLAWVAAKMIRNERQQIPDAVAALNEEWGKVTIGKSTVTPLS